MWQWMTVTALLVALLHVFHVTEVATKIDSPITHYDAELLN